MGFICSFCAATIIGVMLLCLHIPGGLLVGSLIGTVLWNICIGPTSFPIYIKMLAQVSAGAFIGCSVHRKNARLIYNNIKPCFILLGGLLIINFLLGTILYYFCKLDKITAYMCAVPGGLSDIPLIASDLGAVTTTVLLAQFIRTMVGLVLFPPIIMLLTINEKQSKSSDINISTTGRSKKYFLHTCIFALICGSFGKISGIPAGSLFFSMTGVLLWNIWTGNAYLPCNLRRLTQIMIGTYIGSTINKEIFILLKEIGPVLFIVTGFYILFCTILGFILYKTTNLTLRGALLSATPAAGSEVLLIATDMQVSIATVLPMHLVRLLVVVSLFPQVILLLLNLGFPFF